MENKICNCCKTEKDINDYHNNKRFKDNKNPTCKECTISQSKKYYQDNKDKIREREDIRRESEEYKEYRKKYLEENREKINNSNKLYKINNREKYLQEKRDYYQRKKNDPIFALTKRLRQGIYRSIRGVKLRSSLDILGCTEEEFKIHIETQFTEDMSWDTNLQPLWAKDNLSKYNKIM